MKKKDLAQWVSSALKKALTPSNIRKALKQQKYGH
jgi:hypothetical protein